MSPTRYILLSGFICLFARVCIGQQSVCYEKAVYALEHLPELYRANNISKIDSLLQNWEHDCGTSEFITRFKTLMQIERNQFNEYEYDFRNYNQLHSYIRDQRFKLLMDSVHEDPRNIYLSYYEKPDLIFSFNQFTQELASALLLNHDQGTPCKTETLLLLAYSNQFSKLFEQLYQKSCTSVLASYYQSQVERVENKVLVDAALITGAWIPFGNARLLGAHPSLGFLFGFGKRKMIYDFTIEFKFGRAKNYYDVFHNGMTISTNHFFGGYLGFETGYELTHHSRSKLYALGGLAFDGFDAIKSDPDQDIKGKSINSLNLNAGLGWRFFGRDGTYTGLEVRHNFVQYTNRQGTPLNGNTVSVRLLFGLLKNDARTRELEYLKNLSY